MTSFLDRIRAADNARKLAAAEKILEELKPVEPVEPASIQEHTLLIPDRKDIQLATGKRVIEVDSMALSAIQNCPRQAYYKFERHLGFEKKPDYFANGIVVHEYMEAYYNRIKDGIPFTEATKEARSVASTKYDLDSTLHSISDNDVWHNLACCYENVNKFRDEELKIHFVEQPFSVKLYENDNIIIIYSGIIDLCADFRDIGTAVLDHKSQSRATDYHRMTNQFASYANATGYGWVIVNNIGLQKSVKPDIKHSRKGLRYTDDFLLEWRYDAIRSILEHVEYMDENFYPRRFVSCRFCDYKIICDAAPESRESRIKYNYVVQPKWDVYERN